MWNADDPWFVDTIFMVDTIFRAFSRISNTPLVPSQIWLDEETYNDMKAFYNDDEGFC